MSKLMRVFPAGLAFGALLLGSPPAVAEDETATGAAAPPLTVVAADVVATPVVRLNPIGLTAINESTLATTRGGTEVLNVMRVRGVVTNNQAVNVVTGNNTMSDGTLAGASGLPMVIQNTGNNVLIQNATIVNVQLK